MRIACLLIPHFPLYVEAVQEPALRRGGPLALYDGRHPHKEIVDASAQARRAGVGVGMPLAQALSRCAGLVAREADLHRYERIFTDLAARIELLADRVEPGPLGCLWTNVAGLEGLYGSEIGLAQALLAAVPEGYPAKVGVAEGKFPSLLAAQAARPGSALVLTARTLSEFLAPLSVRVLPVPWEIIERLQRFGLTTLGHLQQQEPGPLQAQFGPVGPRLWRLARGEDEEPLVPRKPQALVQVKRHWEPPLVTIEALWAGVEGLLAQAFRQKEIGGRSARGLTLSLQLYPEGALERRVSFREPVGEAQASLQRLRWAGDDLRLSGPVERIALTLWGLTGETGRQEGFLSDVRAQQQLREALHQLEARLGEPPPIYHIRSLEPWSRIPERRHVLVEFDS